MVANDTPTRFTDEDLEKLDSYLMEFTFCSCGDNGALCEGCWLAEKYTALINRLQAAERVIASEPNWIGPGKKRYEEWQERKGAYLLGMKIVSDPAIPRGKFVIKKTVNPEPRYIQEEDI